MDPDSPPPSENSDRGEQVEPMLERLQHATNELYASASVRDCASITVGAAIDILGFDWCVVSRADHDSGRFEVVALAGDSTLDVGDRPLALDEGSAGRVYESREPEVINDVDGADHTEPTDEQIESAVTAPVGDWGVLQAVGTSVGRFGPRDRQLVELLVTPLATTIERIRTERQLREQKRTLARQNDQIEALHAVTTEMKSATTRDRIYELCIEAVEEVLGIDVCTLDERDGDVLKTRAVGSQMALADYYDETPIDQSNSVATDTCERGETILIDDLNETSYRAAKTEYRSIVSVPLGEWGVFQAATEDVGAVDETERRLIELLADATVAAVDRIERERELEQRAAQLERHNERLDRFTQVVSHDIRTPLSIAVGYLQQARQDGDSQELAKVSEALDRMDALVDDTLALARGGDAVVDPDPVTVADIARAQWRDVATEEASLTLDVDAVVLADRSSLGRVFENLFRNAIEHAGEDVTVTVEAIDGGFAVEDDGPGIDAEQPFEHGHSGDDGGTGLGLAITREVVEAHGWEITAIAGAAGGARFEITGVERASDG